MSGNDVAVARDKKSSGMILEDAGSIWLVKATGPHSEALLQKVVDSMKLTTD
jgi:hypothetical protein